MVSFQTPFSPNEHQIRGMSIIIPELDHHHHDHSRKKRKWEQQPTLISPPAPATIGDRLAINVLDKRSKLEISNKLSSSSIFEVELQLETPLPLEWQRCLNIQSGQIHFYNTRTHKRTSRDPRISSPEPPSSPRDHGHMSLDLELNLPCETQRRSSPPINHHAKELAAANNNPIPRRSSPDLGLSDLFKESAGTKGSKGASCGPLTGRSVGLPRGPSWLAFDQAGDHQDQEMVATACTRCHMLVMLCKSAPTCPNCKFIHPPDLQGPPKLFKQGLSLLC